MANFLLIRLATGHERHLHASEEYDFGLSRFVNGRPPFDAPWLETTEGAMVQRVAIVEIYPVTLENAPNEIRD